jgi:GMP synthase (glutamine-hydrolysing)
VGLLHIWHHLLKKIYAGRRHMKSLVIFKVGETFSDLSRQIGDFDEWIVNGVGSIPIPVAVIDPRMDAQLPANADVAGAIVTGSHSMVTDREPWSESLAAWLRSAVSDNIPVLGICYGHQLLAHALGGEVAHHPGGMEIGTVPVRLNESAKSDALFGGMPQEFAAQVVHRQSVRRLPEGAVLLGGNTFEPHHAFRVGDTAWGIQFHPEFSTTAMSGYIEEVAKNPKKADLKSLQEKVTPTDQAASVLPRFANLVVQRT